MSFSQEDTDRIIMMAWEDRTPFEAIEQQFGLKETDLKQFMRTMQTPKSYKRWRERVQGRTTKFARLRAEEVSRFKSLMQKT
jgi:uncharacterized protein (TIGR03643 family)